MRNSSYLDTFLTALKPDPILTVSAWAAQNRVLTSEETAEPGLWRNERTPYLVEIMDSLSPFDAVQRIVVMKATQLGFTNCAINLIGYTVDVSSCAMMYVVTKDTDALGYPLGGWRGAGR